MTTPESTPILLSKSTFVRGIDCVRRAWLDKYHPEFKPQPSLADVERMRTGTQIGALARQRYPGGQVVPADFRDVQQSALATQKLMREGLNCIFEATFTAEDYVSRVDVLWRTPNSAWTIDEVKSSTIKEPSVLARSPMAWDLAYQMFTLSRAGLPIASARLVLIDSHYIWPGGELHADDLMGTVDLTQACQEIQVDVEATADKIIRALYQPTEPSVETNTHCKDCDYFEHCHEHRPRHDLIYLPRIDNKGVSKLRAQGFESIDEIPADLKPPLTTKRAIMRDTILSGKPYLSADLKTALTAIHFPAAFIDYESSNPAFPVYPATKPYQQICFQWSAHVLDSPTSKPRHYEFLPDDALDPRPEFCRLLWDIIRDSASIVHYTHFEVTQLKPMAEDGIPYASDLLDALQSAKVDLHDIVDKHIYFEPFGGRTSIKVVLPVLVPSMSYKEMLIGDGQAAAAGYREMISQETAPDRKAELREALLRYCEQDTLAMVEIYRALLVFAR